MVWLVLSIVQVVRSGASDEYTLWMVTVPELSTSLTWYAVSAFIAASSLVSRALPDGAGSDGMVKRASALTAPPSTSTHTASPCLISMVACRHVSPHESSGL